MRIFRSLLACVVLVVVLAPAAWAAAGFDEVQVIGSGPVAFRPVAAVNDGGERAVAWVRASYSGGRVVTIARGDRGGAWALATLARAAQVRELQLVLTAQGDTVAAWQERGQVITAVARRGGPFGVQILSRSGSYRPRVAALADGRVAVRWISSVARVGRLQLAVRERDGRFSRARQLSRERARTRQLVPEHARGPAIAPQRASAPAIAATSDGGAILAWWGADKTLRAARLDAAARRPRRSVKVARSMRGGPRLAAGPDNIVVAAWSTSGADVSAQIWPRSRQPPRILAFEVAPIATTPASIAIGPDGAAIAASTAARPGDPGRRIRVSKGTIAGGWSDPAPLTHGVLALLNTPRVAITSSGDALVVWSNARLAPGPPLWDVLVARSPRDQTAFGEPEVLGPGPDQHGRSAGSIGVALASSAEHILAAWRAPGQDGGVAVATGH
jgi:hypothetical protein